MANTRLSPKATFVTRGYGQVEPNHLSARRTGQIYAQLPADPSIDILENGQFAYYDYAHKVVTLGKATNLAEGETAEGQITVNGEQVDYVSSVGEPMLVLNEIKLYKDREQYEDFAMKKTDYEARVYSPIGQNGSTLKEILTSLGKLEGSDEDYNLTVPGFIQSPLMPEGATMVPRLLKTNVGDIMTTNTIVAAPGSLKIGDKLVPNGDGYLAVKATPADGDMVWQVVLVYTLADNQPAVKIQRIA